MGWRVKQICTVAPELCPILEGRSKHDETNLEKCFLGFPISTHVSSLGYKKAEEANLQQSADQNSQQRKGRSALGKEKVAKAANLQQSLF